jgi:hypothetical protein
MTNLLIKLSLGSRRTLAMIHSILCEIFDESAYARFLERRHLVTSREAYAAFLAESRAQRERRPRCC